MHPYKAKDDDSPTNKLFTICGRRLHYEVCPRPMWDTVHSNFTLTSSPSLPSSPSCWFTNRMLVRNLLSDVRVPGRLTATTIAPAVSARR